MIKSAIQAICLLLLCSTSYAAATPTDVADAGFFTPGYAEIHGKIVDYNPESDPKDFLVYIDHNLIGDSEPISVRIAEDGSFITGMTLTTPGYAKFVADRRYFDFFIAPDHTLEVSFRWDDVVDYCEKERKGEPISVSPFNFGEDLGVINKELKEYPGKKSYRIYKMAHDLTPSDAIMQLTEGYEKNMRSIDEYSEAKGFDPITRKLLKANVKSDYLTDVFAYATTREGFERTDTLASSLKEPLDLKYFEPVKALLADDDEWMLASNQYGGLPNMMGHSPLIDILDYDDVYMYDFGVNAFPYLKSLGAVLTQEEEEINEWLGDGGLKSCTLSALPKMRNAVITAAERNGLADRLDEFYKQQEEAGSHTGAVTLLADVPRNVRNLSETIKTYLGVDTLPLLWQVALSEGLRSRFQLKPDYYIDRDALFDVLETVKKDSEISNPAIMEALENFYRRAYAVKSFCIPDDARGKVIKDMIAPYAGKTLLIDFWGVSCGPCCHAIKNSVNTREKNRSNPDFKMIFISSDTDAASQYDDFVTKYLEGETTCRISESDFNLLRDLFAFSGIPRYVLIGRDGKVLDSDFKFYGMKRTLKEYGIELEADPLDELSKGN